MYKKILSIVTLGLCALCATAQNNLQYTVEAIGTAGSGNFAPYFTMSNNHGILSQPYSALGKIALERGIDYDKRFSYGFGASVIGGYQSSTEYGLYDKELKTLNYRKVNPSALWLQELYAELKYRSVFLELGLKEDSSVLLNHRLSSGDMTFSGNTRPMPGVKAGFWTPQDIPFTNGWVQISGEIGYYKVIDDNWKESHFNYMNGMITTDMWYNYKYCYFHTKPSQPFSLTIGMQAASQFGGYLSRYNNGEVWETADMTPDLSTFVRMLIPGSGGGSAGDQAYYEGNHVGSWDVMGRYRLHDGTILKAYYQSPWEDGSGIGKLNGLDGLYGIEYKNSNDKAWVIGAVVEYLDLMNQGGPLHWEPDDIPGTQIVGNATGADNYYNNYAYPGYQFMGRTIGSPVLRSPIYNLDGYLPITDTRLRSIHLAVEGCLAENVKYRAKFAQTKSWGTIFVPIKEPRTNISAMIECEYDCKQVSGLSVKGNVAMDRGTLYGNNFGVMLSVAYRGLLKW